MAKSGPKDVFIHLLAIAALYVSAVSFGALIFQYVDRYFPDPLVDYPRQISNAIRWAIASLVIVFPTYVWTAWHIRRDELIHPEKRELKIRRWLLYFTLFAAAVVILGDLVALIYNFLSGGLSARFLLKVITVLFIAAAVFSYYLWNLRTERMASRDPRMRWFIFATVAIVAAATIAGFFVIGSPFQERARRFDERRVGDLQNIQWQIVSFWQRKDRLPETLDELRDPIAGFIPPTDPETRVVYGYRALGELKFELCATFRTESAEPDLRIPKTAFPDGRSPETWSHQSGSVCFERAIDPELYRIEKPAR